MLPPELHQREPTAVPVEELMLPESPDLTFAGFSEEAFAILERLRQNPHIEQYREEKEGIQRYIKKPFARYRDDLVVNWVLPNRLAYETEKNVFSRLLKNDFGAGGCNHHLWMAFYRPGRRRLADAQLWHSLSPDGFTTGLFVGGHAKDLVRLAKAHIAADAAGFLALLNPLLEDERTSFFLEYGAGKSKTRRRLDGPLEGVPDDLNKAQELWVQPLLARDAVLRWKGELLLHVLREIHAVWPLYRFLFQTSASRH